MNRPSRSKIEHTAPVAAAVSERDLLPDEEAQLRVPVQPPVELHALRVHHAVSRFLLDDRQRVPADLLRPCPQQLQIALHGRLAAVAVVGAVVIRRQDLVEEDVSQLVQRQQLAPLRQPLQAAFEVLGPVLRLPGAVAGEIAGSSAPPAS